MSYKLRKQRYNQSFERNRYMLWSKKCLIEFLISCHSSDSLGIAYRNILITLIASSIGADCESSVPKCYL
jgi:hypothetical protein